MSEYFFGLRDLGIEKRLPQSLGSSHWLRVAACGASGDRGCAASTNKLYHGVQVTPNEIKHCNFICCSFVVCLIAALRARAFSFHADRPGGTPKNVLAARAQYPRANSFQEISRSLVYDPSPP